ncbi:CHAT domain-containing protein [Mycena galopus ATCC 62051]|nr:CHAT domain-containing protein [Mycena galopus ATCC 62051]
MAQTFLLECKAASNISDLNTAIFLLYFAARSLFSTGPQLQECIGHLVMALLTRFSYTVDMKDVQKAFLLHSKTHSNALTEDDFVNTEIMSFAASLLLGFYQAVDWTTLETTIFLYHEALSLWPASRTHHWKWLWELSEALQMQFRITGDLAQLDEAIYHLRRNLALQRPRHPGQSGFLNNLARTLFTGFNQQADTTDIALQEALALQAPIYPDRSTFLNNIATAALNRFQQQGDPKDIDEAIAHYGEALMLRAPPHPNRINTLYNFASAFLARFEHQGDLKDVQKSISLQREALGLLVPSHRLQSDVRTTLGGAVLTRFEMVGDPNDLDESVTLYQEALALQGPTHPYRSTYLNNLAHVFLIRFEQQGDPEDIDKSIALHREAVALQAITDINRSSSLNNLGQAVATRFKQRGNSIDLEESMALFREALALQAGTHLDRSISLHNLAGSFLIRFTQQGDPKDIDECIALHREALILRAPPHRLRSHSLDNLAIAISTRFEEREDAKDIDETIVLLKAALALRPPPHRYRSMSLNNLAQAFLTRFKQQSNPQDIDKSIALHREAVALQVSSHPNQNLFLNNLAIAVSTRFDHQGVPKDLDESIALYREALALVPPPHPGQSISMSNLAARLSIRFKGQQDPKDIDEAVALYNKALALQAPPHPHRINSLINLGSALVTVHRHTPNEDMLNNAISAFKEASTYPSSSPLIRFDASYVWATVATQHSHSSSLDAFRKAIDLLPQLAAFHLDLTSRQKILTRGTVTSLASDSAACAIDLNAYNVAVEFLEASRSIFWAQAMHLRTPLYRLKTVSPTLASRLEELSRQLEVASFRDTSLGKQCRQLSEEWEQVISSVRILPGFEDFLKPRNIAALQQAASSGPVIILIAGGLISSALVVTSSNDVQCVHLPAITVSTVQLYANMSRGLSTARSTFDISAFFGDRALGDDDNVDPSELATRLLGQCELEGQVNMNADVVFGVLLELLWEQVVKPVFNSLNLEKSTHPPRLWWCPTGPFAFLPIHAAGIYKNKSTDCVSDYVVSSYTPTLSALLDPPAHTAAISKITAIIEPNAPNCSPLPCTVAELANIMDRVPRQWLTVLHSTTKAEVLHHLQDSSVVHFACHGTQDLKNSLDSSLILSDGYLKVSQIMRRPENAGMERMKNTMSLAFLSACETAKGDHSTPDEAMHLAATVLFAGFRSVVATMWSIDDQDGPTVADTFYEHLFKDCDATSSPPVLPDLKNSAEALHLAVSKLKKEPGITFKRWVPFVHYGL